MKLIDTGRSSNGFSTIGSMFYCPRKYAFDVEAREAAGTDGKLHASATDRGTLVHVALAHHYITQVAGENPADWYPWRDAMLRTPMGATLEEHDPGFMAYLRNLLTSYFTWADLEDADWEPLYVEREYRAKIGGYPLGRRIDLVCRQRSTGQIWFWDHKSTSGTLPDLEMRYLLSGDMLLSRLIGRAQYGADFGGILINKVRVNQKIVNPQFARAELPAVSEATLQSFRETLIGAFKRRDDLKLLGDGTLRPPMQYPGAHNELVCIHRYGLCEHFFRCQNGE